MEPNQDGNPIAPIRLIEERRRGHRFSMCLPALVYLNHEASKGSAVTRDISQAGSYIYVDMDQAPEEGSRLELVLDLAPKVTLADPVKIFCTAKVIRVDRNEGVWMGVALEIESYEFRREPVQG